MAKLGVNAGKFGVWFNANPDEVKKGIIPALWIGETLMVLAICGFAIHRKLKSLLTNKDELEKQDRELIASQAREMARQEREIAIARAKAEIDKEAYIQKKKADLDYEVQLKECMNSLNEAHSDSNSEEKGASPQSPTSWIANYMDHRPLPELPGIIGFITKLSPGIQIAALLNILSMFGAMCFSKVRADYLDKRTHAPNLQVIIEGMSGSGKDFFMRLYGLLFDPVIKADAQNIGKPDKIISTIGVDVSTSSLHEFCVNNK